jgi:hypothetical protein
MVTTRPIRKMIPIVLPKNLSMRLSGEEDFRESAGFGREGPQEESHRPSR